MDEDDDEEYIEQDVWEDPDNQGYDNFDYDYNEFD